MGLIGEETRLDFDESGRFGVAAPDFSCLGLATPAHSLAFSRL